MTNRIVDIHTPDKPVSELVSQKMYRVEVSNFLLVALSGSDYIKCSVCFLYTGSS